MSKVESAAPLESVAGLLLVLEVAGSSGEPLPPLPFVAVHCVRRWQFFDSGTTFRYPNRQHSLTLDWAASYLTLSLSLSVYNGTKLSGLVSIG